MVRDHMPQRTEPTIYIPFIGSNRNQIKYYNKLSRSNKERSQKKNPNKLKIPFVTPKLLKTCFKASFLE